MSEVIVDKIISHQNKSIRVSDMVDFDELLLQEAGITPSGPDGTITASDKLNAFKVLFVQTV